MINLIIVNNAGTQRPGPVDANLSITEICERFGLDLARGGIMVNGTTLSAAEMNRSMSELGLSGTVTVSQYSKLNNAVC